MAIRVKHDPSAAALGESAYTVGRGQRRERDIRLAYEVGLRQASLQLRARGQSLQAERSAEQLGLQRERFEFGKEQDLAGRAAAERRWEEEFGLRKQQWQDEPARQLQKGLQQQELLQKNIAWQYDEGQKREMAKITMGVAWLREQVAAGKWTAEQAEKAEQQLWQKYYSIVPLPVYDDKPTPQERFVTGLVKHPTNGREYWIDDKGNPKPLGPSVEVRAKLYADIFKVMDTRQDEDGKRIPVDPHEVEQEFLRAITIFSNMDEFESRVEQEAERRAQQGPPPPSIEEQAKRRADVAALPRKFEKALEDKKIGRKVGRKKEDFTFGDKVYGEEAYNRMFLEVSKDNPDIPPEVIKAELDKWWYAEYKKEEGKLFQKFGNPMEFEGWTREAAPEERKAARESQGINVREIKAAPMTQLKPIWPQLTDEQKQIVWQAWKEAQAEGVSAEEFGKKAIAIFGRK